MHTSDEIARRRAGVERGDTGIDLGRFAQALDPLDIARRPRLGPVNQSGRPLSTVTKEAPTQVFRSRAAWSERIQQIPDARDLHFLDTNAVLSRRFLTAAPKSKRADKPT